LLVLLTILQAAFCSFRPDGANGEKDCSHCGYECVRKVVSRVSE
jgi:hypothetical protein